MHDRVQQAAYSLICLNDKQTTHIKIGRLLWQNTPESQLEDRIFTITNQLNIGIEHFHQLEERYELAQLNLIAGKKAKASTAYSSAMAYLKIGIQLLRADSWQFDYNLSLSLYTEATEVSYLCGELDAMEDFASVVLQQAKAITDTAKVCEIKIEAYTVQGKLFAAMDTAMEFLQPIGIEFPLEPTTEDFGLALQELQASLSGKTVTQLADLPEMQNRELHAALRVLIKVNTAAYLAKPELHRLLVLKQVALSVQYGNTSVSAFAYSAYGLILCGQPGSISIGYEFGKLALQLLSKFPEREYEAKVLFIVHNFITHWFEPVTATLKPLLKAYTIGLDSGDLAFAGYAACIYCFHAYICGQELTKLAHELAIYGAAIEKINKKTVLNYSNIYHQVALNLIESKANPWELIGAIYDEKSMLALHEQTNNGTDLWHFFLNKLILCYLFKELDLAVEYAVLAKQYSGSGYAMANIPLLNLYDSLLQLVLFPTSSVEEQQRILQQVAQNQDTMQQWANHAPMNHLHRFELVEAEKYRILGQKTEAIELYDKAIAGASSNGYIQEEALANELSAFFYLDWGKHKVAAGYMEEAYYCYARWGAKAKTDDLEKRYPQLLKPILQQRRLNLNPLETITTVARSSISTSTCSSTASSSSICDVLDFTSVVKAAIAISSSIEVDELITTVTKIILENSGALKTVLILPQENTWQVRAITFINDENKTQGEIQSIITSESIDTCKYLPKKIINYVKNTQLTVVIDNCQTDIPGVIGEYMLLNQPKSVLCTPIVNQGHVVGILYLENKITSSVFTKSNLEVIHLLSYQAAISLENARLYQQSQQALQDLQQAQLKIVQSEKMSALGNLVAGVAHEMNNPLGFIAATLEQTKPSIADITEHLKLYQEIPNVDQEILDHAQEIDLDYTLEDLPKMVDAMVIACDRLKNISTSLRTFSRADKDYKVRFNIDEGIDSTILILKHRLKANEQRPAIEVITEYGNLPQIECFPGQLNQVFMNILANAIDALEESNTGRSFDEIKANPNKITIQTSVENNNAKINIADNGKGMSKEVKQKIFDHLFTTKAVGKGTGLGLAIAKQIIEEKHGGIIEVNSVTGSTEFIILIPCGYVTRQIS